MISEVADLGNVSKARYSWLADGAKVGVVGADGRGFEYVGSLVYLRNSSGLQLETANFGGGVIRAAGAGQEINYFVTDHLGSVRVIVDSLFSTVVHLPLNASI